MQFDRLLDNGQSQPCTRNVIDVLSAMERLKQPSLILFRDTDPLILHFERNRI